MAEVHPDEEILEFAIDREVSAYYFFMALANRASSQEMRTIFEDLAQEELEHKAKLELEIMKTGRTIRAELRPPDPDRDYILPPTGPQLDMDYKDMLTLAMEKEEVSFRTYVNLVPNVRDNESRELLLTLAEEEVKHKLRFENEYNTLFKKG